MKRTSRYAMDDDIIDSLRGVIDLPEHGEIDLPEHLIALSLELKQNELPIVHASFHPDLTPLGEFVRSFKQAQER